MFADYEVFLLAVDTRLDQRKYWRLKVSVPNNYSKCHLWSSHLAQDDAMTSDTFASIVPWALNTYKSLMLGGYAAHALYI